MITLEPPLDPSRVRPHSRWPATFSPAGLLGRGLLLLGAFGLVHALGWREHTGFLSLTPSPGFSLPATSAFGITYLVLYFGAVLGTPSLLGAAGLLYLWNRLQPTPSLGGTPLHPSPSEPPSGKIPT
jgi:hypothetical protein